MKFQDCAFCTSVDCASITVHIGPVFGYACGECIEGLALAAARFSRTRMTAKNAERLAMRRERLANIRLSAEAMPRAVTKKANAA